MKANVHDSVLMVMIKRVLAFTILLNCPLLVHGQATQPTDDAAKLYLQAAELLSDNYKKQIQCPAESNLEWPHGYPPYPQDWQLMEETDFNANVEARELAHQARSINHAQWPTVAIPDNGVSYLNQCREISNELADASNYQLTQKNYSAAVELLRDQWHLADLLENASDKKIIRLLVSVGIRAELLDRFETLIAYADLTNDPHNLRDIQINLAHELMIELLKHPDSKQEIDDFLKAERTPTNPVTQTTIEALHRTVTLVNAERDMAALSLACHIYRFNTTKWPTTLVDLYGDIATAPTDPWGDGIQTFGYTLIQHGLPDGSDRPLVYDRNTSKDGLFFRTDQAAYSYYQGDGTALPVRQQKKGGQFRDVAGWVVPQGVESSPATQPLR